MNIFKRLKAWINWHLWDRFATAQGYDFGIRMINNHGINYTRKYLTATTNKDHYQKGMVQALEFTLSRGDYIKSGRDIILDTLEVDDNAEERTKKWDELITRKGYKCKSLDEVLNPE